jgi:hypothetical protein
MKREEEIRIIIEYLKKDVLNISNRTTYSVINTIIKNGKLIEAYQLELDNPQQEQKLYTQEEVIDLLETQRGNCYVAILNETRNNKLASIAATAPEPGGRNGSWKNNKL